jgi:shikimate dehydrogenase
VLAAVIGHPISHSLSPVLHNRAYQALGLRDWHYEAIDCDELGLADLLTASRSQVEDGALAWAGFSCTMPLKRLALQFADEADPIAAAVGAANTLVPGPGGGWRAAMTDVDGITESLIEAGVQAETVCVIGAGGTAQAALAAVGQAGASGCTVLVRDLARTGDLRATAERLQVDARLVELRVDAPELDSDLIISTLPSRAADPLAQRAWRSGQAVLDAAYDPWPSALGEAAARGGALVISGALMLLHQAAVQVWLMTGEQAPLDDMRAALRLAAPGCGV